MALTESNMLSLGTVAPDFVLPDTISGENKSLTELKSDKATVIMFICNHCPYVIHVNPMLVQLAEEFMPFGVSFIALNSNDIKNYPQDAPDKMSIVAKVLGYPFPYLFDESQAVAKAYDAACTPDFYVFDRDMRLTYRGRLDASSPGNKEPLTGQDLRLAILATLVGEKPSADQRPSMGCNIKWKS